MERVARARRELYVREWRDPDHSADWQFAVHGESREIPAGTAGGTGMGSVFQGPDRDSCRIRHPSRSARQPGLPAGSDGAFQFDGFVEECSAGVFVDPAAMDAESGM